MSRLRVFKRPAGLASRSLAALTLTLASPLISRAQDEDGARMVAGIEQQVRSIFEKCRPAVVKIEASDARGRLSGTGFFIDPNGTLYTSYSIGGESRDISVICGQTRHPAQRLVADIRSGVALLKVEAETPFLVFGKSGDLCVGSPLVAVGYPFDLPASPTFGVVGGFDIKYLGRYFGTTHIRANIPVQRGQGGAPLLNLHGQVVGILISSLDHSGSFALPIEAAEKVRRDFLRFREVRRGWLGIEVGALAEAVDGSTVSVKDVLPESPALKAGIVQGDVILRVGDRAIVTTDDVLNASFFLTADDSTPVLVARGAERLKLVLQSADHPDEPAPLKRIAPAFGPGMSMPTLEAGR